MLSPLWISSEMPGAATWSCVPRSVARIQSTRRDFFDQAGKHKGKELRN